MPFKAGSGIAGVLAVVMLPLAADGAVIPTPGPGNISGDQNVLFNTDRLDLTVPSVEGDIGVVGLVVTFTGEAKNWSPVTGSR